MRRGMNTEHEATSPSAGTFANRVLGRTLGLIGRTIANPSRASGAYNTPAVKPVAPVRPSPSTSITGTRNAFANNPFFIPPDLPPAYDDDRDNMSNTSSDVLWDQSVLFARQLQNDFDLEDRRLHKEHTELAAQYMQTTFHCRICMDELLEEDVARVDDCTHTMCRTCLRDFVSSKIQEHRYPIFCPVCTIAGDHETQPGVLSRALIEQLGVSEEQSQALTEMELAEFTVPIYCRVCKRSAFMDREDHLEATNILCPQSDCHHMWCRKCEQTIVANGPQHSCDGSSELDQLMQERGWKHCPNCTTPIQKEGGCNHMTCISPGCNTHFCYVCGGMIVRSALNNEIDQAVSAHFRRCQLFEVAN